MDDGLDDSPVYAHHGACALWAGLALVLIAAGPAVAADAGTNDAAGNADQPAPVAPAAPVQPAPAAPAAASAPAEAGNTTQLGTISVVGQLTGGDTPPPAYAGGQVATGGRIGLLGEQNAANVPFSAVSFTSQLIDNQQTDTVAGVLSNDASVQTGLGFGNYAQAFQIRGFNLDGDDISFGGLYGVLPRQIIQTNFVERVELFKGASAFANGVGPGGSGVGGAVNLEPKMATDKGTTQLKFGYESDARASQSLDIGRRYGDQKQWGLRVNLQHADGDTAIHDESREDTSAVVALDYRGDRAQSSLFLGYMHQNVEHGRSTVQLGPDLDAIPSPPDAATNYQPDFAGAELTSKFGLLRGSFDITRHWHAYGAVGAQTSEEDSVSGQPVLSGGNGDATVSRFPVVNNFDKFTGNAGFRGDFDTGPVSHKINLGYSGYYQRSDSAYDFSASKATNIYRPLHDFGTPTYFGDGGDLNDPYVHTRTRADGWAISDTAGLFDDRLLVTVGGRYQSLSVKTYSYTDRDVLSQDPQTGHRLSPVYGLVYKPTSWLSLYANHIEALQPGDTASITDTTLINGGQSLGIRHSKQNEVGAKFDFGNLGGSIAAYEIKQPSAEARPLGRDGLAEYGYFGEQRNRGLEFNLHGQPTDRLTLLASATLVDSEITESQNGYRGNDAIGVPDYRLSLTGDWQLPGAPRWHANAQVIRSGAQYADAANDLKIDGWTRVDLGLRYNQPWGSDPDQNIVWRANVENVADANYWSNVRQTGSTSYLTLGEPRTFKLSATFNFD